MNKKIVITGSTGFIGGALTKALCERGVDIISPVRKIQSDLPSCAIQKEVGDLSPDTDFSQIVNSAEVVIHTAGRAHIFNAYNDVHESEMFRRINTDVTLRLAKQAAEAGVKRFIFLSTIGVNGRSSKYKFSEKDTPNPHNAYSLSKWEAEEGLQKIAEETMLEVVIIRPPLVYGPGAKGNFASIIKWLKLGIPLPLGKINNKRSFLAIDNLVGFILLSVEHPKAVNETFLLSDGDDISTSQFVEKIARAMKKKLWVLSAPVKMLLFLSKLFGRQSRVEQLFGSLQIDATKARDLLGWQPTVTMDEQLRKMMLDDSS